METSTLLVKWAYIFQVGATKLGHMSFVLGPELWIFFQKSMVLVLYSLEVIPIPFSAIEDFIRGNPA